MKSKTKVATLEAINAPALASDLSRAETARAAVVALALGAAVIFSVGFAHTSEIHNAAHDTRHALSFPCH